MSITKRLLKSKPECKVTFLLDKEACAEAKTVHIVGDFNEWDKKTSELKKNKDGDYVATINLKTGRDYQYRYLVNGEKWVNDWEADYYTPTEFNSENSAIRL